MLHVFGDVNFKAHRMMMIEGREEVSWELVFAFLLTGKMGFLLLGTGIGE